MELRGYFDVLKRHWRLVGIVVVAILLVVALASLLMPPTYQAQAILRIGTPLGGSSSDTNYETTFANHLMNTYVQIALSDEVQNQLKQQLGVRRLPTMTVQNVPDSEILQVLAEGRDPQLVIKAANGLANILASYQDDPETAARSTELDLLGGRKADIQAQLAKYQQQHDDLVQSYAETTAKMAVLDQNVTTKAAAYQTLQNQYEQAVVQESVFPSITSRSTKAALLQEMDVVGKDLDALHQQYMDLSQSSSSYLQQITLLRQNIQSTQSAYSALLTSLDNVSLASLRQTEAQRALIISAASEPPYTVGPGRGSIIGLGLIVGLILGVVSAFLAENLGLQMRLGKWQL